VNWTRDEFLARIRRPLARERAGRTDWYRLQNKAGEKAALYIYDEIGYWGDTAASLVDQLGKVDADEIDVHISSPGGDIFDGLAIYQALKSHKAKVTVKVDGLAASIASVIAMAGDTVIIAPKASMMIHDGWTMAVGNAAELRKTADLLDKQSAVIASVYADRSNRDANFWRDQMREETWYTAQEALDAGLVDEIEGQEKEAADEPFDLSVFAHAGRENAPAPKTQPALKAELEEPPAAPPVDQPKVEETPFTWDFSAFKSALTEGVK
jgi:ATP-dependent protease ClpP protease subunit